MKNILVLGAGQSATYLISYLLEQAPAHGWTVTVGDRDVALARRAVGEHPRGEAVAFDFGDEAARQARIAGAALVVSLLPAQLQSLVAEECARQGRHLVTVSYQDRRFAALDAEARRRGVLLLAELGLDPGIDLMSAMEIIHRVRADGGQVESFESYGSGVPAPEVTANPLRYCITWNPRNVVMAGELGAQYLADGKVKVVPWHHLFHHTWPKVVAGFAEMEAYPNRDSLAYRDKFGIPEARTLVRGTLRYPGWGETWQQIVRLGLPNEHVVIPDLGRRSFAELVETFLPAAAAGASLEQRLASHLGIAPTGRVMSNLRWLGLFGDEPIGIDGTTAAEALAALLKRRLALPPDGRDAVILLHEVVAVYGPEAPPEKRGKRQRTVATFVEYGVPGVTTAMAKTVGLPAGIAAKLILTGELTLTGCQIPTEPAVYTPILRELEAAGLKFDERTETLEG